MSTTTNGHGEERDWTPVRLDVPTIIVEVMERCAEGVGASPGLFGLVCLLQGFAMQCQDNGHKCFAELCMELASTLVKEDGHIRYKDVYIHTEPVKG